MCHCHLMGWPWMAVDVVSRPPKKKHDLYWDLQYMIVYDVSKVYSI